MPTTRFPLIASFFHSFVRRALASVALVLLLIVPASLTGCDTAEDDAPDVAARVLVANGGNFSAQQGSITVYDPDTETVRDRDGLNVAFINSLAVREGTVYVVDNTAADNAGRITLFDAETFARTGQIQNPRPPRAIAFVSETKAYVTNLSGFTPSFAAFPSSVSVVDLATNAFVDSIRVGRLPEGLAVTAGKAFVANSGDGTLSVLDTATDIVTATLDLNCSSPNEVFVDGEGEVVVVCEGSGAGDPAQILFLDPATEAVTERLTLDATVNSINASQSAFYAAAVEELYAISGNTSSFGTGTGAIFRIDTDANARAASFDVPSDPGLIGMAAVGYDAGRQELTVARLPVGDGGGPLFDADGTAMVLGRDGALLRTFPIGNAPTHVALVSGE